LKKNEKWIKKYYIKKLIIAHIASRS